MCTLPVGDDLATQHPDLSGMLGFLLIPLCTLPESLLVKQGALPRH